MRASNSERLLGPLKGVTSYSRYYQWWGDAFYAEFEFQVCNSNNISKYRYILKVYFILHFVPYGAT
jgi:hypothetical protein